MFILSNTDVLTAFSTSASMKTLCSHMASMLIRGLVHNLISISSAVAVGVMDADLAYPNVHVFQ